MKNLPDGVVIYVCAVLFYCGLGLFINTPGQIADAHYYYNGARALAAGEGFTAEYFWLWINPPEALPAPSFRYWQPLASIIGSLGIWAFGWLLPTFKAAQLAMIFVAALLPVLSYSFARQLSDARRVWLLAAVLTVLSGILTVNLITTENFGVYGVAGGGALLACGFALKRDHYGLWVVAGVACGFAHLARADAPLLLGVVGLLAGLPVGNRPLGRRITAGLIVTGGYLLVMTPWFARNLSVFGGLLGPGGASTLWLTDYSDLFDPTAVISFESFMAYGLRANLLTRVMASARNALVFVFVIGQIFFTPLMLYGLWVYRRRPLIMPTAVYVVFLYIAMSWGFALQGMRGAWLHSITAALPALMALTAVQARPIGRWVAGHVQSIRQETAHGMVMMVFGISALLLTTFVYVTQVIGSDAPDQLAWEVADTCARQVDAELDRLGIPDDALIMSSNSLIHYTYSGRPNILTPAPSEVFMPLIEQYDVQAVVISDCSTSEDQTDLRAFTQNEPRLTLAADFMAPNEAGSIVIYLVED